MNLISCDKSTQASVLLQGWDGDAVLADKIYDSHVFIIAQMGSWRVSLLRQGGCKHA